MTDTPKTTRIPISRWHSIPWTRYRGEKGRDPIYISSFDALHLYQNAAQLVKDLSVKARNGDLSQSQMLFHFQELLKTAQVLVSMSQSEILPACYGKSASMYEFTTMLYDE
jgi:hypothetical protein